MIYYKIRNKADPTLFRNGGVNNNWSKLGKVWPTLGQLRIMLTMNMSYWRQVDMSDWEIVEYEVTEKAVKEVHEVISQKRLIKMLTK